MCIYLVNPVDRSLEVADRISDLALDLSLPADPLNPCLLDMVPKVASTGTGTDDTQTRYPKVSLAHQYHTITPATLGKCCGLVAQLSSH